MDLAESQLIALRLRTICLGFIEGLNVRDFNPDSPRWHEFLAPHFRLITASDALFDQLTPNLDISKDGSKHLDAGAMCDILRQAADANPMWHTRVVDTIVTVYSDESPPGMDVIRQLSDAEAEVWMTCAHSGIPEGVTRSAMWVGYFTLLKGRWLLVGARHASGMGSPDFIG